jgi:hypothetical protein
MKRWLKIGGLVMLVAWLPFLYAELTSGPAPAKKGRALPDEELSPQPSALAEQDEGSAVGAKPEPVAEVPKPNVQAAAQAAVQAAMAQVQAPAEPGKAEAEPSVGTKPASAGEPQEEAAEEPPPPPPPSAAGPAVALKRAFETEPRDPLWAADTETRVKALAGSAEVPAELLQSAACRHAVCKVELRWTADRAAAYVSFYEAVHKQFEGDVGVEPLGKPDDKGQELVNLYLTRKGYTVADLSK